MGQTKKVAGLVVAASALLACAAPEARRGPPAGLSWPSHAVVTFESNMGGSFDLVQARAVVDGETIFECDSREGSFEAASPVLVHDGPLPSGEHTLGIELRYRGRGHGVFSYLRGYVFDVSAEHTFVAPADSSARVHVEAFDQGGPSTPLEDRPALRFSTEGAPAGPLPTGCPPLSPADS